MILNYLSEYIYKNISIDMSIMFIINLKEDISRYLKGI